MPVKKEPDPRLYDERLAAFWSDSYEAALYRYSRELGCAVYERLTDLEKFAVQVQHEDKFSLRFVLSKDGTLRTYDLIATSYVQEFDRCIEQAFLASQCNFGMLPACSADYADFELNVGTETFELTPCLFQRERELLFVLRRALQRFNESHTEILKIRLRHSGVIVEPAFDIKSLSHYAEQIASAIHESSHIYPVNFPEEISLVYDPTRGGLCAFSPERLGVLETDRLDRLKAERRQETYEKAVSEKLANVQDALSSDPSNLSLLQEAASLALESHQLDDAIRYCDEIICLKPKSPEGFVLKGNLIENYVRQLSGKNVETYYQRFAEHADEILNSYEQALARLGKEAHARENVWLSVCLTLASAGRYENFIDASKQLLDEFNLYQAHRQMANWFECQQAWADAICEWTRALQYVDEPLRRKVEQSIHYCEERLASSL